MTNRYAINTTDVHHVTTQDNNGSSNITKIIILLR